MKNFLHVLFIFLFSIQILAQDGTFTFSNTSTSNNIVTEEVDGVTLSVTSDADQFTGIGSSFWGTEYDGKYAICKNSASYFNLSFSKKVNISTIVCYDAGGTKDWKFTPDDKN